MTLRLTVILPDVMMPVCTCFSTSELECLFTFALFHTQELHRVGDAEPVEGAAAGPARGPRHGVRQRGGRQRHLQKVPRGKSKSFMGVFAIP